MLTRLFTSLLGLPDIPRDLERRDEDGLELHYSPSADAYWVPKASLRKATSAAPGEMESMIGRRLAVLREWADQHPIEWFAKHCPADGTPMHKIAYPTVSCLTFYRRDGLGIWITSRELERIVLHDPAMDGAAREKAAGKAKEADADAPTDGEGNVVESGVGGNPVEKGATGDVAKVWIIPGCIVCDLCEEKAPDVFKVTEETSTVQMASQNDWSALSTEIVDAAVGCPVDVIKYELKPAS